mgnify:CR=1 FL=1
MNKKLKKLLALFMAAALVLAMALPAFAETNSGTNGSIKIDGTVSGETYTIYKLFNLDSYDAASKAYSYTVVEAWEAFFKTGAGKDYITLDGQGHPTWDAAKSQESDRAEFAKLALKWAADNKITGTEETATGNTVTFSDLGLGYYLVDSSLGALCGLNTTPPNVTITEKNGQPTIEKLVKSHYDGWAEKNTAKIGDTVEFKIVVHVEAGAQKYVVADTMEKGLSFISDSLAVTYKDAPATANADYTLEPGKNGTTFTLTFADSYVADKVGDAIVVTYNATLTKDAVVAGNDGLAGNKNSATLHYGNKQTVNKETTTYTYEFDLVKVDGNTKKLLNGAEFKLYTTKDDTTALRFVKNGDGSYRVANGEEPGGTVDTIVVNGKTHISGLDKVNYWLEETRAPDGYNKLTERQEVELSKGSQNATMEASATAWAEGNGGVVVENHAGTVLPSTGGMGTTLFYVVGGGLMVAALVLLVTKKRMENKN